MLHSHINMFELELINIFFFLNIRLWNMFGPVGAAVSILAACGLACRWDAWIIFSCSVLASGVLIFFFRGKDVCILKGCALYIVSKIIFLLLEYLVSMLELFVLFFDCLFPSV